MGSVLKKRHAIFCAILIGSLPLVSGCSDLADTLGSFLPFLKSESKTEEPVVHKLKPTEEIRTSIPAGGLLTPSAVVPIGDEGEVPGKPGAGGPNGNDTAADKKPPVGPEKQPPGTETAKKEDEKAAPPAGNDKDAKPPVKEEPKTPPKTPAKPSTEKVTGGAGTASGEDIAMVALLPGSEAPSISDLKPVDSLMDKEYVYDPTGKRDPFRPFNLKVEKKADVPPEELTPLQRYNLSQLKLTAIIYDSERETGIAMVEAPDKKGYNIIVGSEIGGGKVVRITETDVQVEMRYEDFYGNTEKRIETLKIAGGK
jgi:type IV pilus assembly protein PilP